MAELFNVTNLFNVVIVVVAWSIRQELYHIRQSIDEAKDTASQAHKRIDNMLVNR